MSRNIGDTSCYYCHQEIKLDEEPRPTTKEETGAYYDEYATMPVANATCTLCEAKYLACIQYTDWAPAAPSGDVPFVDLSFRSTFNDEPGPDDTPRWKIGTVVTFEKTPWPTCTACEVPLPYAGTTYCCAYTRETPNV